MSEREMTEIKEKNIKIESSKQQETENNIKVIKKKGERKKFIQNIFFFYYIIYCNLSFYICKSYNIDN